MWVHLQRYPICGTAWVLTNTTEKRWLYATTSELKEEKHPWVKRPKRLKIRWLNWSLLTQTGLFLHFKLTEWHEHQSLRSYSRWCKIRHQGKAWENLFLWYKSNNHHQKLSLHCASKWQKLSCEALPGGAGKTMESDQSTQQTTGRQQFQVMESRNLQTSN